ncbi:hypothetical protein ACFYE2_00380 [Kocuria sp. CPCC 205300]|uniref:hypothetical protein n=1 Tax=Kocuria sabuli TaxID=3071448 RepID=UPI0036DC9382
MRPLTLPALGALGILVLTGCGGEQTDANSPESTTTQAPSSTPAPEPTQELISTTEGKSLEWYAMGGATGTITFRTEADPQVERYRTLEGRTEPTVWADVDIDNRAGTDTVSVYDIALYTEAGEEVLMTAADQAVTEWANTLNETNPDAYTGELYDLVFEIEQDDVNVGQRATHKAILEGELPEEVTRVALVLEGGEEVEAYPAGGVPPVTSGGEGVAGPSN